MKSYLKLVKHIYTKGFDKTDRTGVGTRSSFGHSLKFNLQKEFPIVKAKFTSFKMIKTELLWLLSGNTNIKFLVDNNCHIWDDWADENGDLGPVYGSQWRAWKTPNGETIDQIANVIHELKNNPDSRRIMVNAWNVADIQHMKLPPCHFVFNFNTRLLSHKERLKIFRKLYPDNNINTFSKESQKELFDRYNIPFRGLSCMFTMRSVDTGCGLPYNISSYAMLTHMIAQIVNMEPLELVFNGGDCHIYNNHFDGIKEMLSRDIIKQKTHIKLNENIMHIDDFKLVDIELVNYTSHPPIKLPIAV